MRPTTGRRPRLGTGAQTGRNPRASTAIRWVPKPAHVQGSLRMELARLELATSWVRSTTAAPAIVAVFPANERYIGSRPIIVNRLI